MIILHFHKVNLLGWYKNFLFGESFSHMTKQIRYIETDIQNKINPFMPLISFFATFGFLIFSGNIERDQWHEMGQAGLELIFRTMFQRFSPKLVGYGQCYCIKKEILTDIYLFKVRSGNTITICKIYLFIYSLFIVDLQLINNRLQ